MATYKRLFRTLFYLLLLASPFLVWWQWHNIYDWYRLRGYSPPAAISAIAAQDKMTSYAQHIFYVNHPQLESDVRAFHTECPSSEQTIVLGCYLDHETGIYIYDVKDAQLNGVQQVTAAHEMLHGAYERLSSKDRTYVNGLLNDYYTNDVHDQRIIDTINAYKKSEPNDVVNEMHSVFGTEIDNLPKPLEDYYSRYFTNREVVVAEAAGYEAQFTGRLDKINADDAELAGLKQNIDSEEQSLSAQSAQLQTDRAKLDSLRSSNQIAAYNAAVGSFNNEVDAYNQGVSKLRSDINSYNDLVNSRNALASELRGLDSAIDTRLTTQSAQ